MTDRELIEAAAKAAGMNLLVVPWPRNPDGWFWCDHSSTGPGLFEAGKTAHGWNPLVDDGQALRLAVKLRLEVSWWRAAVLVETDDKKASSGIYTFGDDPAAATRRAITRAAAALAGTATGEKP